MVYFKGNYNFTRFREGGGVQPIPGGGGRGLGVQMVILETHRTFDFPGGVRTLYPPPLDPHMWPFNYS